MYKFLDNLKVNPSFFYIICSLFSSSTTSHYKHVLYCHNCYHQVSVFIESLNLCSSSPPSFPVFFSSGANWKTSVIILILAQIWWDQRWPAGRGRAADGCVLRGDLAKALQVFNTSSPLGARVGGIRLGEPT